MDLSIAYFIENRYVLSLILLWIWGLSMASVLRWFEKKLQKWLAGTSEGK